MRAHARGASIRLVTLAHTPAGDKGAQFALYRWGGAMGMGETDTAFRGARLAG